MKDTVTYTIDATGKRLGRVASEAAKYLMGKDRVSFTRQSAPAVSVVIEHASKLMLTEKKSAFTTYARYSGYQGGLKIENLKSLSTRLGYPGAIRRAVRGMLPNNKLRPGMLKRLTITD